MDLDKLLPSPVYARPTQDGRLALCASGTLPNGGKVWAYVDARMPWPDVVRVAKEFGQFVYLGGDVRC